MADEIAMAQCADCGEVLTTEDATSVMIDAETEWSAWYCERCQAEVPERNPYPWEM